MKMHPSLRNVTTAVFLMGLALPGCANRLGPVRTTQSGGSTGHANLPDNMVERARECMELHGSQLEPGRVVLESTVEVNEDGAKVGVTIADIPATAPDLGACMRNALRDMPIAEQPFREALETLKFHRKHANDSEGALRLFIEVIPGVPIVESELVLEVDGYTVVLPVKVKVRAELETLIDGDKRTLAKLGQLAIDTLGYDEIMRRAKQVGWVKTVRKIQPKAPAGKGLIAQSETEVVVVMFEVFTEYAVTAGVVSQVDSPLPGPADLAAIGILAVGLYKVGAVAIDALSTATAPAPTSRPPPPPPPPPPPQDPPRREKPDKCPKIKEEIHYLIYEVREATTGDFPKGYQGLAKRWEEYATNKGKWGYKPDGELERKPKNHIEEYRKHQRRLRGKLDDEWTNNQCEKKGHILPDNAGQYAEQEPQLGPGKPLGPAPLPVYSPATRPAISVPQAKKP